MEIGKYIPYILIAILVIALVWLFSLKKSDKKDYEDKLANEEKLRELEKIKRDSLIILLAYQEKRDSLLLKELDSLRNRKPLKERVVIRINELEDITDEELQELFTKWYERNKDTDPTDSL